MPRLLAALDRIERAVIALLAGAALFIACQAILARYLFPGMRMDWTFEVTIFLLIWCMFLSAARLIGEGGHVRIDLFLQLMPMRARNALGVVAGLLGICVAVLLVVSGLQVVEESIRWQERTTSSLRLPLWVYYLSLPVGAALLALRLAVRVVQLARGRIDDRSSHEGPPPAEPGR
jgi:C4-dicarboxylate transporter DctQ subunit